jgi:hypothetical protein
VVTGPVASVLPANTSPDVRNFTVRVVLEYALRDWVENENLTGLDSRDAGDLQSFVEMAIHVAFEDSPGQRSATQSAAIYRAVLHGMLEDWLHNWNVSTACEAPTSVYATVGTAVPASAEQSAARLTTVTAEQIICSQT